MIRKYILCYYFFFCKQKSAYDMRVSDWSSDVCSSDLTDPIIIAVPKGRILDEALPLLAAVGIVPEPAFSDDASRALRFATNDAGIELIRVRAFDVATFVAHGAAQLGIVGSDVLMEFDYPELYAPVDLRIGHCRLSVAEQIGRAPV